MNIKDFIKKRNAELEKTFIKMLQCLYGGDSMEQEAEKIIQDFNSTSLHLFAEKIKKELKDIEEETMLYFHPNKEGERMKKLFSDLAKMLE